MAEAHSPIRKIHIMIHKTLIICHLAAAIIAAPATTSTANTLGMEAAVQTALMANPALRAARTEAVKAQARLRQSGRWPNPTLSLSGMSDVAFRNEGAGAVSAGLSQEFPLTSRLADKREIANIELLESLREIRDRERILIHKVQAAFISCLAARARSNAFAKLHDSSAKNLEFAREQLTAGRGSLAEQALALASERRLWNLFEENLTAMEFRLNELKTLLGLGANHPLDIHGTLASVIQELEQRTRHRPTNIRRPDLEIATLAIDRAGVEEKLAATSAWEGVQIGVEYVADRGMDEPEGLGTDQFLGVSLSIPLPLWDRNEGEVAAQVAAQQQARAMLSARELAISNTIASLVRRTSLLRARLSDYPSKIIAPVEQTAEELEQAFREGRVDLRDILAVRQELADLHIGAITIEVELANALASLEAAAGTHPEMARPYLTHATNSAP
jgi:outer membrane protein, heavy metal efflux system